MVEINLALVIWAIAGAVIIAILLACPPWMHKLPRWLQVFTAIAGGPVSWLCIAFFAYWVFTDEGPVPGQSSL